MITRRTLLSSGTATGTAALLGGHAVAQETEARLGAPLASFVSAPDLFNGDVGDLSTLSSWDGGPNSVNESWQAATEKCLSALAQHRPDAVLVAGDLVEGRWNLDTQGRGLFGQVSQESDEASLAACRQAITTAGGVYYGHYRRLFHDRGLRLLPALGDHEILDDRRGVDMDDRWSPGGRIVVGGDTGAPDNRYHLVPHAKSTWADHFTTAAAGGHLYGRRPRGTEAERTAYAVDIGTKLTVVTVDVFSHTPLGVRIGVFDGQLEWLRRTIRTAKRQGRVVVVQGHVPILQPYRSLRSGGLRVPQGRDSPLFKVLKAEGADFWFCGEVHDTSVRRHPQGGPVQVCHGSIFRYAFNYVHGRVYSDGSTLLDYYEMTVEGVSPERGIWSTDHTKAQPSRILYGAPAHRGTLLTRQGRIRLQTDKLAPYAPSTDTLGYRDNLAPAPI